MNPAPQDWCIQNGACTAPAGMARAFQQGQLNLMGSLIGLSERRRTEQAP